MKKYKHKPNPTNAVQFAQDNMHAVTEFFMSLAGASQKDFMERILNFSSCLQYVGIGDYLVINEKGNPTIVRREEFERTYEEE